MKSSTSKPIGKFPTPINRKINAGLFELPGDASVTWPMKPLKRTGMLAKLGMPALA
jgi:hypothetical protein